MLMSLPLNPTNVPSKAAVRNRPYFSHLRLKVMRPHIGKVDPYFDQQTIREAAKMVLSLNRVKQSP